MPILTLSFLVGIVAVQQLTQLPNLAWLIGGLILSGICSWKRLWFVVAFLLGILWASLFAGDRLNDRLPKALEGREFNITGEVISLPQLDSRRVTFDFFITQAKEKLPHKVRLSWYNAPQTVSAGQHWQFTVKLKRPHGMFNPTGFDYETFLFTQNIGAVGYIRKPEPHLLSADTDFYNVNVWRQAISNQLTRLIPNSESLGLIKALSIGDGNEISDVQWQVFRKTGTIHLIVISGSHISLVAGMVFFLVRKLWAKSGILAISPPTLAAWVALFAALFYSALAGFSVPTQRAMIMVVVAMSGIIFQRHIKWSNTLALALLLVLILDPLAVLAPGFWLSFGAVFILLYCSANRLGKSAYLFPLVTVHFIMTLSLAPLLLFFFQQIALISAPPANFIAIPCIEIILVPLILIALLLIFPYPFIATKLLLLISQVLNWLYILLNELANLPFAVISNPQPSGWAVLLASCGILLWLAPKGIPARRLSVILCLPLVFVKTEKIKEDDFTLTLLDVGQGLSAVVQTAHHNLIFDTGAKMSDDFDMGKVVVLPFLTHQGIKRLDRLIISHGDNDHIGGAQSLIAEMKTDSIYTSVPDKFSNHAPIPCFAGQQWQWDNVTFTMLSPTKNQLDSKNDNSCVLKIESTHGSALLTGDIEAAAENQLVNSGWALKSDVLIAPHHGSKTSSTLAFLQAVHPRLILIPAAYKNRYHFPHPSVIERYQKQQIKWLMTGTAGAIKVKLSAEGLESFAYRTEQAKYWHDK